jgi:hypothetical protein
MRAKKTLIWISLPLILSSLVFSQTLAEIAKKERERRESLKGRKARVVTNADLAKLKKKPALEVAEIPSPQEATSEDKSDQAPSSPSPSGSAVVPPPGEPAPEVKPRETLKDLEQRWEKAKEYVELLTLKMSSLWQAYYGLDAAASVVAREAIQRSIAETFIKLEKAQEDEAQARRELETFLGQAKKDSTPSIWIK